MILIDTSAWIEFFKGRGAVADLVDHSLLENQAVLCGPVYTELLRGFKTAKEKKIVLPLFGGCRFLSQPAQLWEDAGDCGFELRRKGKTVKSMDLLIACYAMAYSVPLLTLDKDFSLISAAGYKLSIVRV